MLTKDSNSFNHQSFYKHNNRMLTIKIIFIITDIHNIQ